MEETIAANTMGSVIHEVLEDLYKPFIDHYLSKENIAEMQKNTHDLLVKYFEKYYEKGNIETGKNKLIFEVCKNHIKRFLNQELQILNQNKQLKIIALEKKLSAEIILKSFPVIRAQALKSAAVAGSSEIKSSSCPTSNSLIFLLNSIIGSGHLLPRQSSS